MKGRKVLVTGASGQIGRGLAHVLAKGNEVHALARFGNAAVLQEVERKVEKVWRMNMGVDRPAALPTDFDAIFHMAVAWNGDDDIAEQRKSFHLSCDFVADLMLANEKAAFVLGSTGSVYQHLDAGMVIEDETPLHGGGTYVTAKIAMLQAARWVGTRFGRPSAIIRYCRPYAAYKPHPKVDKYLTGNLLGTNPMGVDQRTYIKQHVDNTIAAAARAKPEVKVFNSATPEKLTQAELAAVGAKVSGAPLAENAVKTGEPEIKGHIASAEKSARLLGPMKVDTEEGFRRYWRARQENILWPEDWMFED